MMPHEPAEQERLVIQKYLLGQLPQDQHDELEDRFAADPEYFAVYQDAERNLVLDYVRGDLTPVTRELFERNYLVTEGRKRQVLVLRALLEVQAGLGGESRRQVPWMKLAPVAMAAILLAVGLKWISMRSGSPAPMLEVQVQKSPRVGTAPSPASKEGDLNSDSQTGPPLETAKVLRRRTASSPRVAISPPPPPPPPAVSAPPPPPQGEPVTRPTDRLTAEYSTPDRVGGTNSILPRDVAPPHATRVVPGRAVALLLTRSLRIFRTENGGRIRKTADGKIYDVRTPSGKRILHLPNGGRRVHQDESDSKMVVVRTASGRFIIRLPNGERWVQEDESGSPMVVATSASSGYIQRPFSHGDREFLQRTYYVRGASEVRAYRLESRGGITFTPTQYYPAAFYSWLERSWLQPIAYDWWWARDAWYSRANRYFTPDRTYDSPLAWLSDYVIARSFEADFDEHRDGPAAAFDRRSLTAMSQQVKQSISEEIRRQIVLEQSEISQNAFFEYDPRLAIAGHSLEVGTRSGECLISAGDVLKLNSSLKQSSRTLLNAIVVHSGGCRPGAVVEVEASDLEEMQNQLHAAIGRGMEEMRSRQGQGGLPVLPPDAAAPARKASFTPAIQAEENGERRILELYPEALQEEADVLSRRATVEPVETGMTLDQVTALRGKPDWIRDLSLPGARPQSIYRYGAATIVFVDGKVTDIQ